MNLTSRVSNYMKAISINGQEIKAGENKTVILNSYELHTKSSIKIPVHVIRSKKPGPTILFSAGLHGEETNGIEIIRKLVGRDEVKNLKCGTIIAIPVINIVSFLYLSVSQRACVCDSPPSPDSV